MEDVQLPVEQVDCIISEWMEYFLFSSPMLGIVLCALDKVEAARGSQGPLDG